MLHIRPHHINCIFFFKGLGYDFKFTSNMSTIISELQRNPKTIIKLVTECDSLCSHCPNKCENNKCVYDNKVKSLDYNTLKTYGLTNYQEYPFDEIIDNIYRNYDYNKFEAICRNCEWFKKGVCSKELINEHKKNW